MGNSEVLRSVGERVRCAAAWKTWGGGSSENENRSPRTVQHPHVRHAPGGLETGRQRQGRAHVRGSAHGEQQAGAAPLTGAG